MLYRNIPNIPRLPDEKQLVSEESWQFESRVAPLVLLYLITSFTLLTKPHEIAERLEVDPTKIPAPDFASGAYTFMQIALIADANTPEITTEELAAQRLKAQWEAHIEELKVKYEAQLQEAEALRDQRRQEAVDAERLAAVEQKEKESEKKHLPIYSFQKGVGVDSIPLIL
ncbi:hypothetical protein GG344DRAFT_83971 [Lentinula edodes]|nr:hypothetical protein GG344DRAFT_83971 [Lentinula edodes]